jgi:diguanylate cyclase (GGDEF)-like protein/PAS domain S-box-containing protein
LRERVAQLEQHNAQLGASEERLQILFEHAPDGYYLSDLKGALLDGNAAAERITGYKKGELIGKSLLTLRLLSTGDVLRAASLLARNVLGKSTGPDEFTLTRKDGTPVSVEILTHPVRIGNRRVVLGIARDITERKRSEEELRLSEARLEEAQRTARVGSWETNLVTTQVTWSDELCRLFEIAPEVIREGRDQVQAALVERIHPDDRARYEEAIAQSVHQNARYDIEYRIRWSDGSQRYLHSRGGPTLDPAGNVVRLSGTVTDITERKQLEEQLARMARHDPLTGVLNRYALEELLEREASRSERYTHPIGFLMIDVNRFKEINDRFGHAMGDKVLQAIAAVIQGNIRDADILVRYGGDEFLVILPETNGETDIVRDRILAEVAARNTTNPLLDFPVTLAIGSAHWSSGSGQTMEQILAETDKLMYEDKRKSPPAPSA